MILLEKVEKNHLVGGEIYGRLFNVIGDAIDGMENLPKEGNKGL